LNAVIYLSILNYGYLCNEVTSGRPGGLQSDCKI